MYKIKRYHFSQISSTNDYAKELISSEKFVAVTADYQWNGRGRGEKVWEGDQARNVYCSIGMRHDTRLRIEHLIALQAQGCLAAKNALQTAAPGKRFALKYPNDVLMLSQDNTWKKICGVLVEHEFAGSVCVSTVIGIGINIRQKNFPATLLNRATSLLNEDIDIQVDSVTETLVREWERWTEMGTGKILEKWKGELHIEGKIVEIVGESPGWTVKALLEDGRLLTRHMITGAERVIDNGDSIRYEIG